MEKAILELVNDFSIWRGNPFTLASMVAELQKDTIKQKLIDAGETTAADLVEWG